MSYQIELHPEAVLELEDAYQWYEMRSEGLGKRFMTVVNKRMQELSQSPGNYAKKKANHRAVAVDTFPYVIVYEILKKEKIVFVSYVFHTKRNPHLKYKR
jgi:mRNA-degrading endonuclease RelE of RelBE toxin-antitoxin system